MDRSNQGLEGPYTFPNGQVLYYDTKQQSYYDPRTDFFIDYAEVVQLQQQIFDRIAQ